MLSRAKISSTNQWRSFKFRASLKENHSGPLIPDNPLLNFYPLVRFTSSAPTRETIKPSVPVSGKYSIVCGNKMHKALHFLLENSKEFSHPRSQPQWAPNPRRASVTRPHPCSFLSMLTVLPSGRKRILVHLELERTHLMAI